MCRKSCPSCRTLILWRSYHGAKVFCAEVLVPNIGSPIRTVNLGKALTVCELVARFGYMDRKFRITALKLFHSYGLTEQINFLLAKRGPGDSPGENNTVQFHLRLEKLCKHVGSNESAQNSLNS